MERIISDDEKIRKAEEIYYRRNNQNASFGEGIKKKKTSLKDRFFLHLLIMLDIAIIIFSIQNREYIFTEQFLNCIKNYNNQKSSKVTIYIKRFLKDDLENTKFEGNSEIKEESINEVKNENITDNLEENNSVTSSLNQMDSDIQNIKALYSFKVPVDGGIISSKFGTRTSEIINVSGYHTGIDLAAVKGTLIECAMEGIVDSVSSEGNYGNHIKIRSNNITTLYAHCDKIFVKQGQIIAKGQKIATVGNTGNSTGPHLHFEIRVDDRFVNPEKILYN